MTSETIYDNTNNSLYVKYLKDDDLFCLHVVDELNNHKVLNTIFDLKNANISPTSGFFCMLTKAKTIGPVSFIIDDNALDWLKIEDYGTVIGGI